jgi:tRNA threonylcarbamoyladenosine biosynthesis protein TsaE
MQIHNKQEMREFAQNVLRDTSGEKDSATILLLSGDLGSGKTTFVKALARELGITEHITSPTFVIEKEYTVPEHPVFNRLVHIDAYRLENMSDLEVLGWDELTGDPKTLICLEWPEMVGGETAFDKSATLLQFEYVDESTRGIKIKGTRVPSLLISC